MDKLFEFKPDDLRNLPTFRAAYSDRTALLMGRLAHRSYEMFEKNEMTLEKFQAAFGRTWPQEFHATRLKRETGTAGFVAASCDIIVVVFRGSDRRSRLGNQRAGAIR